MNDWMTSHLFTVDEYVKMVEVGILQPDARVELIEGVIVDMPTMGPPNFSTVLQLNHIFVEALGQRVLVSPQLPVIVGNRSMPQPDFALLRRREDVYRSRLPTAADTFLVVEVSDTSLRFDLNVKAPLYARHGIPEVWVLDLNGRKTHVFRDPQDGEYTDFHVHVDSQVLGVPSFPGITVDLTGILNG